MKKKYLPQLLLCMVLIAGCFHGTKSMPEDTEQTPLLGVALYTHDDPFISEIRDGIVGAAADGANLIITQSSNLQQIQNAQVDTFIAAGVKGMAINSVNRIGVRPLIARAKSADVPIVFFNREPLKADMFGYDKVYYVGAKPKEAGLMQGRIAVDFFKKHPDADKNGDGIIQYVMLKGEPEHRDTEFRTAYSILEITKNGMQVEKLAEETAMWDRYLSMHKMTALIKQFGERIELVLANNDEMALGAIEALKTAGYFKGANYIPVIGVDANRDSLEAIEDGFLLGTVLNDGYKQGEAAVNLLLTLVQGKPPKECCYKIEAGKYIWLPHQMVTKLNYMQFQ